MPVTAKVLRVLFVPRSMARVLVLSVPGAALVVAETDGAATEAGGEAGAVAETAEVGASVGAAWSVGPAWSDGGAGEALAGAATSSPSGQS
ncbi:hypothetical protein, partial [Marmoricola sp. RAF53]|uniref:hypothetical protein n=1 Tax=Marmoricola sp. RAF53 TaxID=3233059 RepID=UPI003F9D6969